MSPRTIRFPSACPEKKQAAPPPGLRYPERAGPERRGCSSSPTRPSAPPPRSETDGPAPTAICTPGCRSWKFNDITLANASREPEAVSAFTAASVVPPRLEGRSRQQRGGESISQRRRRVTGRRAETSASAPDGSDPQEFGGKLSAACQHAVDRLLFHICP